jgi:dTMP kinase
MNGLFISLEGIDGAGKSTQAQMLAEIFRKAGHDVVSVREPGSTPLAERVRPIILDTEMAGLDSKAELLLYLACRAQLVSDVIRPALERGEVVISDRYADSSVAYQGYGRELGVDMVRQSNALATGGLQPDLTLLVDVPVESALERRIGEADRLEAEERAFHERIRAGFLEIADQESERVTVVDGRLTLDKVAQVIEHIVVERFPQFLGDRTGRIDRNQHSTT